MIPDSVVGDRGQGVTVTGTANLALEAAEPTTAVDAASHTAGD